MFPLLVCSIALILSPTSNNNMKSFKTFLLEMAPPQVKKINCDLNGICDVIRADESAGNEQKILSVYKDSKGLPTIGHGHLVTKESSKIFGEVFAKEQKINPNFVSSVLSGKSKITPDQAERLLQRDVSNRLPEVVKLVPSFEKMTPQLQANLASEHFRGMLGKSPNALKALNAGDYEGFAKNYVDAKDYRESKQEDTGIYKRMDRLVDAAKTEVARQKKLQQSSKSTTPVPPNNSKPQTGISR
jgi:GH24 family phage-related lysozyme (muramidase)